MAKAQIDVYKDWLGIAETNRPLNHYQLLRLPQFEDNTEKIRKHYRDMNAHIRKYASGDYAEESQALLNELAKAMLCLTDAARKMEYDAALGRKVEAASRLRRTLEDILLANNIVPPDRMKQVKGYADAVGIDLQEAVLQQKLGTPETVMLAYAESIGLPFVSIEDVGVAEEIAPQINPNTARQHSFVPVMADHGTLILASPKPVNPDVEEELRMIFEMPVRCAICTTQEVNVAIAKYYPKDAVQMVAQKTGAPAQAAKPAPVKPASAKSAPAQAAAEPAEPLSDEAKKQRFQYTVVGFCMTCAVLGCGLIVTQMNLKLGILFYPLVLCTAAIVSGATWFVTGRRG